MGHLKTLTILHSNDLHGEFSAKEESKELVGGVSRLSGYIDRVRAEEETVLYVISGDMFRGSLIDAEYKGISTIEIMNLLAPDVVTIGNHEVDYGLAHLLFVEKCARFPIINANMHIKSNMTRLFKPCEIIEINGMKILFIGILTEEVLAQTKQEGIIGTLVDVEDAAQEVGRICNAYQTEDIDFTVLLTHIGFEEDKKLAAILDPRWGVDIIIGGHSHTIMEEPYVVSGIPIVQTGTGTERLGRFDIVVDTDTNSLDSYTWKNIEINGDTCPRNTVLEVLIEGYKEETERKYMRVVGRFPQQYTHPVRNAQTQLGTLFSDIFRDALELDIMLLGSGSVRKEALGPIVTLKDLTETFPYDDALYRITVTGAQLMHIMQHLMRDEALSGEGECYQFSRGVHVEYAPGEHRLVKFTLNEQEINHEAQYRIGLQQFHYSNIGDFIGISLEEASQCCKPKVVSTSSLDIVDEYLTQMKILRAGDYERVIILS